MRESIVWRAALGVVVLALTATVLALTATGAAAEAAREQSHPPAEYRLPPYSGALPPCADAWTLNEVASGFASREAEFWRSGLAIEGFERISEIGYRTNGLTYIPRRYCQAEALFNDGVSRRIVFNIGEALGFIGIGNGVTWCVVGLDRNHAFSPNCRAAGP